MVAAAGRAAGSVEIFLGAAAHAEFLSQSAGPGRPAARKTFGKSGRTVVRVGDPVELEVSYGGDSLEIGFNSKYLLDIAQQIESESAQFVLADAASPTIVQDVEDPSALYVLMPMRV